MRGNLVYIKLSFDLFAADFDVRAVGDALNLNNLKISFDLFKEVFVDEAVGKLFKIVLNFEDIFFLDQIFVEGFHVHICLFTHHKHRNSMVCFYHPKS